MIEGLSLLSRESVHSSLRVSEIHDPSNPDVWERIPARVENHPGHWTGRRHPIASSVTIG
jgi:hypothetical protein